MARILKWKVSEKPSGPYGSFHHWSWPTAEYRNGEIGAQVTCSDDYKSNKWAHAPLYLWLADHSAGNGKWEWRKLKQPLADMKAVKDYAEQVLKTHPHFIPKETP